MDEASSIVSFEHRLTIADAKQEMNQKNADGKFQMPMMPIEEKDRLGLHAPMFGGILNATTEFVVAGAKDCCVYVWKVSHLGSSSNEDIVASFVLRPTGFRFDPRDTALHEGSATLSVTAQDVHKCNKVLLGVLQKRCFVRSVEQKDIIATVHSASENETNREIGTLQISPLKRSVFLTKRVSLPAEGIARKNDSEMLEIIHSGHKDMVKEVACSRKNRIASASNSNGSNKGTVIVWDLDLALDEASGADGDSNKAAATKDHFLSMYESDGCITSLAFTGDGNRIAVGGSSIIVFELVTIRRHQGKDVAVLFDRIQTLHGWSESQQQGVFRTIALSDDESALVSGSSDLTLRVWDLAAGVCRRTMTRPKRPKYVKKQHTVVGEAQDEGFVGITKVVISPDGKCVAFGGNGHLMVRTCGV